MRYLKNFSVTTTYELLAKELSRKAAKKRPGTDKTTLRKILQQDTTDWRLYTCVLGENIKQRVSASNPPVGMVGLIADYEPDEPGHHNFSARTFEKAKWELPPTYYIPSQSGGLHAVWEFDKVLQIEEYYVQDALKLIAAHLGLIGPRGGDAKVLGPTLKLDVSATLDCTKYYTWSGEPRVVLGEPLEAARMGQLIFEKHLRKRPAALKIAPERARVELEKQYPQLKDKTWENGSRTELFWEERTNATSGWVTGDGIYSHVHNQFFAWSHPSLLGRAVATDIGIRSNSETAELFYLDQRNQFWYQDGHRAWAPTNEKNFRILLRCTHSVTAREDQDELINYLATHRRIKAGANMVCYGPGVHTVGGMRILNTSMIKPMPAAEGDPAIILEFLRVRFADPTQFEWFIAWLAGGYQAMVDGETRQGPMLVITGPTDAGKTYIAQRIFGRLLGGAVDACSVLFESARFTGHLQCNFAWTVDDPPPATFSRASNGS